MADIFRSAFNKTATYLSQANPQLFSGWSGGETHPLVGQVIELGSEKYRVRSLIAEGGFALVFLAQNSKGDTFALKRQLAADKETEAAIKEEINILREVFKLI
jgi:cyclin G-associated kinase